MRDFLNAILNFIGSSSLTDQEFEDIDPDLDYGYNVETYDALKMLLIERNEPTEELKYYFMAKGVDVEPTDEPVPAKSNIFIGAAL